MEKSKTILVDSSVIFALFNKEDRLHQKARTLFGEFKKNKNKLRLISATFIEMVSVMKYKKIMNWQKYAERLVDGSLFYFENAYFFDFNDISWDLVINEDNIGMVDAIEIEHCILNNEDLATFDKNQMEVFEKTKKSLRGVN
jgi:predicted nucleic acid-binding protein